jgi:hypothetical protein
VATAKRISRSLIGCTGASAVGWLSIGISTRVAPEWQWGATAGALRPSSPCGYAWGVVTALFEAPALAIRRLPSVRAQGMKQIHYSPRVVGQSKTKQEGPLPEWQ